MIQNNGPTFFHFCDENKLLLWQGDSEATKSTGAESGFYSSGRPARPSPQIVAYSSSFNASPILNLTQERSDLWNGV
jgi:hypothetical protein